MPSKPASRQASRKRSSGLGDRAFGPRHLRQRSHGGPRSGAAGAGAYSLVGRCASRHLRTDRGHRGRAPVHGPHAGGRRRAVHGARTPARGNRRRHLLRHAGRGPAVSGRHAEHAPRGLRALDAGAVPTSPGGARTPIARNRRPDSVGVGAGPAHPVSVACGTFRDLAGALPAGRCSATGRAPRARACPRGPCVHSAAPTDARGAATAAPAPGAAARCSAASPEADGTQSGRRPDLTGRRLDGRGDPYLLLACR